jgi:acyl-CoA synthetase (NDP forming)
VPGLADSEFTAALKSVAARVRVTTVVVMLGRRAGGHPIAGAGARVPVFGYPEDAARALAPVVGYVKWRDSPRGRLPAPDPVGTRSAQALVTGRLGVCPDGCRLDVDETRLLLSHYGIDVAPAVRAASAEAAANAAERLGYPVVLKVSDPEIVHRTDVGGVRLGLSTPAAVRAAYAAMPIPESADGAAVIVAHQVEPGRELIAGVVQDDLFGPLVMCGYGGTDTEVIADRTFRLAPLTTLDAASAVRDLRTARLLFGHRGAPAVDVAAVEDLLVRLGRLADDLPQVAELDLNPVIVHEHGIALVDAKVRLRPCPDVPNPTLPRLRPAMPTHQGSAL